MAARKTSLEVLKATYEAWRAADCNDTIAAHNLGIPRTTLQGRIAAAKLAAMNGEFGTDPVIPGFEISSISTTERDGEVVSKSIKQRKAAGEQFAVPDGQQIRGVSALVDADGRVVAKWLKTGEERPDPAFLAKVVREAFDGYRPAAPIILRRRDAKIPERLAIYIIADSHLGLLTHVEETGEDNNLEIAVDRLRYCMVDLVEQTPPSEKALVINLGDAFHTDNNKNMTPASGNILDVASRIRKTAKAAVEIFRECIDMALVQHNEVIVKHLPGNHDPTTSIILETGSAIHYKHNPRVVVDEDQKDYFCLRYGRNLVGAHHGHRLNKPEEAAMLLANEYSEDWGDTDYRYWIQGHLHHSFKKEVGGILFEGFRTIAPPDAFHSGKFQSGRSLTSVSLDKAGGEHSRYNVNIPALRRKALRA